MRRAAPTLIIDMGGTLLRRSTPGAYHRAADCLADLLGRALRPEEAGAVAERVLTGADRAGAAAELTRAFGLNAEAAAALARRLHEAEGEAWLLPGAVEALDSARRAGWKIVVATNAARWVPPLPEALATRVDIVFSSAELGVTKQSPRFWSSLLGALRIDPRMCMVVGDDGEADVAAPRRAGLLALRVGVEGTSLPALAALFDALGPPPEAAEAVVAGVGREWAGQWVLEAPHLAPLVQAVTRCRIELVTSGASRSSVVVRRRSRPPAVVVGGPEWVLGYAVAKRDTRPTRPPLDLQRRLEAESLTIERLSPHNRRHLISLVREATDPATRAARVEQVVGYLKCEAVARQGGV